MKETYKEDKHSNRKKTEQIDAFITHKLFGIPVFIFFMWIMFQATFTLGSYPMDWIESLVSLVSESVQQNMSDGSFKDMVIDGVIGGVGGVIVFLPNILILFFFISLMEDTGYMARAAFIMDRLMHKIGLHGKSFIPLIMGFGCNVPAIMATRTLENKNDRLLTMLINPFMSCSARLPVYILLIGAFFPDYSGTVLFVLYFIGILMAVLMALLLKKILFKATEAPFVMELPPYRVPTIKSTTMHMWHKGAQYLKKMGGVILIASIIVWALGYYPQDVLYSKNYIKEIGEANVAYNLKIEQAYVSGDSLLLKSLIDEKGIALALIKHAMNAEKQEQSYIGRMGQFVEPVIEPLGFDWKMGVSLLAGVVAKEIVVSTMAVLYQADSEENQGVSAQRKDTLIKKLRHGNADNSSAMTPVSAFAFMIFILLYFPCIATIAAINKESGSWKWAIFTVFYTTALAWIVSFIVYQVGSLFV
jgi:ferrous iron transport protein B